MVTKRLGKTNLLVSRIGLGTAEIGLAYGLGSKKLPTDQEADYLMKSAVEMGVTYFDTAPSYGLAEERIGKSGIAKLPGVVVGTKCGQFGGKVPEKEMEKKMRQEVETSLRKLKLDVLPLLQFHQSYSDTAKLIENGFLPDIMQKFKKEGLVQYIGISIRDKLSALAAIRSGIFETVQVPYNLLDKRMHPHVFAEARKRGVGIISRSVFLKGVLTADIKYLPHEPKLILLFQRAGQALKIAQRLQTDLPVLALRFVFFQKAIATSLIGTHLLWHLTKAKEVLKQPPLSSKVLSELYKLAIDNQAQTDPYNWSS